MPIVNSVPKQTSGTISMQSKSRPPNNTSSKPVTSQTSRNSASSKNVDANHALYEIGRALERKESVDVKNMWYAKRTLLTMLPIKIDPADFVIKYAKSNERQTRVSFHTTIRDSGISKIRDRQDIQWIVIQVDKKGNMFY